MLKQLQRIAKGNFTDFTQPAGEAIRNDIISNIKHQITPDGSALKKNAPETLRIKRRLGFGNLSLVARFRMLISNSTYIITAKKKSVELTLIDARKNIGKILEGKGYRFFGISAVVREKIFRDWREFILKGFK